MRRPSKIWSLVGSYAIIGMVPTFGLPGQAHSWPVIKPLKESHTFINPGGNDADTPFLGYIKNTRGVPVYKVECHNGNYEDESEINFSGDFQCALFAVKGNSLASGDLLATNAKDEQSTDWWNRGRMRSTQLQGKCLTYPEYSTIRHFRVRGMLITFGFTDLGWSDSKDRQGNLLLEKFTFTLDVIPDKTAQSPTAEQAAGPPPPSSCYP